MIHLVRHGRTAANAAGLLLGRLDPPLDDVGEGQASALAAVPALAAAERVISSPLARCRATAAAIAATAAVEVEIDDRLIELDYGDFDGRPLTDVAPEMWARWRADITFAPPRGESIADVGLRVRALMDELVPGAVGADIVVVSHVSPIKAALAWALGVGDEVAWRIRLDPASMCRLAVVGGRPSVHAMNHVPAGLG